MKKDNHEVKPIKPGGKPNTEGDDNDKPGTTGDVQIDGITSNGDSSSDQNGGASNLKYSAFIAVTAFIITLTQLY